VSPCWASKHWMSPVAPTAASVASGISSVAMPASVGIASVAIASVGMASVAMISVGIPPAPASIVGVAWVVPPPPQAASSSAKTANKGITKRNCFFTEHSLRTNIGLLFYL